MPFQGKIIRHISFKEFGFDQSFTDTTKKENYFGTRLLNKLHRKTREWVIRDNLLIEENTPLDAFKVADNERFYRSLEFIQDARILVKQIPGVPDSVDLEVVTKDFFSLTGSVNNFSPGDYQVAAGDANVMGMGQKVAVTTLLQNSRVPSFGYSLLYTKTNIRHTFINLVAGYSTIAPSLQDNMQNEHALTASLQMPLVSPYAHFAGAVTLAKNETFNSYGKTEAYFFNYGYNTQDAWVGYNLDAGRYRTSKPFKDKHFIALRYFKNNFYKVPFQIEGTYNYRYNYKQAVLAQLTFFKQDFVKTNYIYGFGTTEDVPVGYNISVTGGWFKQLSLQRPYAGINAYRYVVDNKGGFTEYFLRAGAFYHNGGLQDATLLMGIGFFSKVCTFNDVKIRQYINVSYTRLYNREGLDPLKIDNIYGLRNFSADSVLGSKRISLYAETFSFLKYKLFGFKFAPFAFAGGSLLTPENMRFGASDIYEAVGAGVRTRNENFVFGTIELRCMYFPRYAAGNNTFKITINTNLNFRFNSNYVSAPDLVQPNTDIGNVQ